MLTVRASTLDSFRLYHDPDVEFISTEEMEARLRGESFSNAKTDLGTAFHCALAGEDHDGYAFEPASIERARSGLAGALSETFGSIVLDVDGVPVRVTGHADWLRGLQMVEIKTSEKPIAPDKYAESMQWRCYVLIFGIERVIYRQVQLEERVDSSSSWWVARVIEDVVFYPYPKLQDDVVTCLRDLVAFAKVRGCLDAMDVEEAA